MLTGYYMTVRENRLERLSSSNEICPEIRITVGILGLFNIAVYMKKVHGKRLKQFPLSGGTSENIEVLLLSLQQITKGKDDFIYNDVFPPCAVGPVQSTHLAVRIL